MWICYRWCCSRYFSNLSRRDFLVWNLYDIFSLGFCKFWIPRARQVSKLQKPKSVLSHLPRPNGAMHSCANCRRHTSAKKLYNHRNLTLKTGRSDESWILRWNSPVLRARLWLFFRKLLQIFPKCFPTDTIEEKNLYDSSCFQSFSSHVFISTWIA